MSRQKRDTPKSNPTFALVVDGKTEVWYFQMLKQNERNIRVSIKPEIPQKKSVEEQYKLVCELSEKEFTKVFWIVDLDSIIHDNQIQEFVVYREKLIDKNDTVTIVNNPCLEFWFLLHFKMTTKLYKSCDSVEKELVKYLNNYEKTEKFFKKKKDIYLTLKPFLTEALKNASDIGDFDSKNPEKAMCQMELFFQTDEIKSNLSF